MITKVNNKKIIFRVRYKALFIKYSNCFILTFLKKFNPIIVMTEEGMNHWRRYNIQNTWP